MPSSLDRWKELNSSQRRAVTAPAGPLLVLAGAGSGKTRAIAYRIAFLIHERGVPPWSILALTFTNKAAGEMRSRVASLLKSLGGEGRASSEVAVYTFHALALRLLRRFGTDIGLPHGFAIYD
ncbi:MAG: UvrD-helicase domain-containing protein, partial [Acidobacteriota bacterium]